jgi:hypothetical protein
MALAGSRLDARLRLLAGWLADPSPARLLEQTAGWGPADWQVARRLLFIQGLGPYFQQRLAPQADHSLLPAALRDWLEQEHARNAARLQRFRGELQTILRAAQRAGIAVMPLKGSLLAFGGHYADPATRPLADLDLLAPRQARQAFGAVLVGLGYRCEASENPYSQHDRYVNPAAERVVAYDGEHPDNPRPVELHFQLKRPLWGQVGALDLTDQMWEGARQGQLLGEPAWLPQPEALLTHLAIHASGHFAIGTGRMLQWLDLGLASRAWAGAAGERRANLGLPGWEPCARQSFLACALAARALPGALPAALLSLLDQAAPAALRRWCHSVPLDRRCGLSDGALPGSRSRWARRWQRWAPLPWRLALGYGAPTLPRAYLLYLAALLRRLRGK